ncbi:MAG TPA: glycosyltransferase family 4 protein, partial [Polyangia bacterium]|nr:glycosyltransferase family 4 protein [Polyangia bacterium]
PPSFRLLLAGRVSSASYSRQVSAAVRRHGLDAHVQFLGAVSDMRELYAATDVVLMPSRTEASPIAALEALSCGLPVLISAAANTDAVLIPGHHGWQVDSPTVQTVADALAEILRSTRPERVDMGAASRAHVVDRFTCRRVTADFVALYGDLMRNRAATT